MGSASTPTACWSNLGLPTMGVDGSPQLRRGLLGDREPGSRRIGRSVGLGTIPVPGGESW